MSRPKKAWWLPLCLCVFLAEFAFAESLHIHDFHFQLPKLWQVTESKIDSGYIILDFKTEKGSLQVFVSRDDGASKEEIVPSGTFTEISVHGVDHCFAFDSKGQEAKKANATGFIFTHHGYRYLGYQLESNDELSNYDIQKFLSKLTPLEEI